MASRSYLDTFIPILTRVRPLRPDHAYIVIRSDHGAGSLPFAQFYFVSCRHIPRPEHHRPRPGGGHQVSAERASTSSCCSRTDDSSAGLIPEQVSRYVNSNTTYRPWPLLLEVGRIANLAPGTSPATHRQPQAQPRTHDAKPLVSRGTSQF